MFKQLAEDLDEILMEFGEAKIIGGYIRDLVFDSRAESTDIDIVTNTSPNVLRQVLSQKGRFQADWIEENENFPGGFQLIYKSDFKIDIWDFSSSAWRDLPIMWKCLEHTPILSCNCMTAPLKHFRDLNSEVFTRAEMSYGARSLVDGLRRTNLVSINPFARYVFSPKEICERVINFEKNHPEFTILNSSAAFRGEI